MYRAEQPSFTSKIGTYRIISTSVDCDLQDWSLLEFEDGSIGWAKDRDVALHTEPLPESSFSGCKAEVDNDCEAKLKELVGSDAIGINAKTGELEIKLIGDKSAAFTYNGGGELIDFRQYSPACTKRQTENELKQEAASAQFNPSDISLLNKQLQTKKGEILRTIGLKDWSDPRNPFKDILKQELKLNSCDEPKCPFPPASKVRAFLLKEIPDKIDITTAKDLLKRGFDIDYALLLYRSASSFGAMNSDNEAKDSRYWLEELKKAKQQCSDILPKLDRAKARFGSLEQIFASDFKGVAVRKKKFNGLFSSGELVEKCRVARYMLIKTGQIPLANMEATICEHCSLESGTGGLIPVDALLVLQPSISDIEKIVEDRLANIEERIAGDIYTAQGVREYCHYDPFASSERVEKILSLVCVDKVFVPDAFIQKNLPQYRERLQHKLFDSNDRFSVRFKPKCEGRSGVSNFLFGP
jgi:hypothetical protein